MRKNAGPIGTLIPSRSISALAPSGRRSRAAYSSKRAVIVLPDLSVTDRPSLAITGTRPSSPREACRRR